MIYATAMGDAYAVAWEFVPENIRPVHNWSGYQPRPKTGDREPSPAGTFTDDTLRTIANARVLMAGEEMVPLAYVREIKQVFREDRRMGWSKNFQAFLESQLDRPDAEWLDLLKGRNTNGALMGAPIMGILNNPQKVMAASRVQARVTHDAEAADYASAVSLASFAVRTYACKQEDLLDYVLDTDTAIPRTLRDEVARTDKVDMSAARTAGATLHILMAAKTQRQVIDMTIAMTGDTDSVAAAVLGIASQDVETYSPDLPQWMVNDLEGPNGEAQRLKLWTLTRDFRTLFPFGKT